MRVNNILDTPQISIFHDIKKFTLGEWKVDLSP